MQLKHFLGNLVKASLALGALAVPAFAGADYYDHGNSGQQYIHHNDCSPCGSNCYTDSCCGHPINPAPECGWAYNPPAYARCGCDTNNCCSSFLDSFAFRADFLWWRACVEGIELGTEEFFESYTNSVTPPRVTVFNKAREKRHNFKYDPGFRIGLANTCACDCWDFAVNWTHFRTKAKANGFSNFENNTTFISEWERVLGAIPQFVTGHYKLNIDLVDIEFGRKFYVSNCFVLRPEFGLRVARVNQSQRVFSESQNQPETPILSNFRSQVKARSDFLAVGPRVGIDIELDIGCGLTLFGQGAGSILFGKFDNHARENLVDFTTTSETAISDFNYEAKDSSHRCSRAITDIAFGVKWQRCIEWCNRSHPVSLAFAWEHHAFYNFNEFNFVPGGFAFEGGDGITGARKHGDLFTQGLTVSLAFGF